MLDALESPTTSPVFATLATAGYMLTTRTHILARFVLPWIERERPDVMVWIWFAISVIARFEDPELCLMVAYSNSPSLLEI